MKSIINTHKKTSALADALMLKINTKYNNKELSGYKIVYNYRIEKQFMTQQIKTFRSMLASELMFLRSV